MYYDHKNVNFAKELRNDMTPWERKLWYCFLKTYPTRIQRQKVIGHFIADFFCAKARLVIELDGGGHYTPTEQKKDEERTRKIEEFGYYVLRFSNRDIDKNFYSVCTVIDDTIKRRTLPQSACSADSPLSEGAKALE
jgi:very-short-patch-repair endonuclease